MAEYRVKRWPGFDGPAVSPTPRGPLLFEETHAFLKDHIYWPHDWTYELAALWVMQANVSWLLNSVFYLLFSGTTGSGKTTGLDVLAGLTDAVNASDISVAALVTELEAVPDRALVLDEFDVARDAERDSALSAICRNGYTRGKPYIRNDPRTRSNYELSTFGPKAIGFRRSVDDALEDRGFPLPVGKYTHRDGFRFVQHNDGLELGDLPRRLREWGQFRDPNRSFFRKKFKDPSWAEVVEGVVGSDRIGANRESQLASVALQVCRIWCIDISESLRLALNLRRETAAANCSTSLEEAREILGGIVSRQGSLDPVREAYPVRQREFADGLNAARKGRGERPLTSGQVAGIRNDLGIDPSWLTHPKNRTTWNIPAAALSRVVGEANPTNPANPTDSDGEVRRVSQVRPPSPGALDPGALGGADTAGSLGASPSLPPPAGGSLPSVPSLEPPVPVAYDSVSRIPVYSDPPGSRAGHRKATRDAFEEALREEGLP